jgi:uncharacterized protein YraI
MPEIDLSDVERSVDNGDEQDLQAGPLWLRWLIGLLLFVVLLVVLLAILLWAIPSLRTGYLEPALDRLAGRPSSQESEVTSGAVMLSAGNSQSRSGAADETPATPTPTPHPAAALDFALDGQPGSVRWQIAYAGAERGPEKGCAYLSFWLAGDEAGNLTALQGINAELTIYDGAFVFERYGPTPLAELRSRGEPRYYELPAGAPDCQRHRFGEVAQYAGMEFRLELRAGSSLIRLYRGALTEPELSLATLTPTPTLAPPTATPYPQARMRQIVNVRNGPGASYELLGTAQSDAIFRVVATTPERDWLQIDFQGQRGWVLATLVEAVAVEGVPVDSNVPPTPIPTPTLTPVPPTATPTVQPTPYFPFLLENNGLCEPNAAITYFNGKVVDRAGDPVNGVCLHVAYEGPRNTKCTGCDGAAPGVWGFAPFGNLPGKSGLTVRIYVVPCPEGGVPIGGQNPNIGFGPLSPVSPVWTWTIGESVQCTGITFMDNRYFDEKGNQIPPPAPTTAPSEKELHRFSGSGPGASPVLNLEAGPVVVKLSHGGQEVFMAQLLTSTGKFIDQVTVAAGQPDGAREVMIPSNGTYFFAITSSEGAWTLMIERP